MNQLISRLRNKVFPGRSLTFKLTVFFLMVSLTGILLIALLIWGINALEFNRFITDQAKNNYVNSLSAYYQSHGSWAGVADAMRPDRPQPGDGQPPGSNQPPPFALADTAGKVIVSAGPYHTGETLPLERISQKTAVLVNDQVAGYVLSSGRPPSPSPFESRYLARMNQAMLLASAGAALIAILLGLFLARSITRPVRELTLATGAMARGQLNQQVPVRSRDELGELTRTFNRMSADLQRANQARKLMTADIAHDLRTPLAVITGYLEGLKDGVLKPTQTRFEAMYDEALYLQRLIEDLRTLSLADAGELSMNPQPVRPGDVIERIAASFSNQAGQHNIRLETAIQEDLPVVSLDLERTQQALGNLVSNALRYTPEGGVITLTAQQEDGTLVLEVNDTGQGIAADVLPHVFERFYRADSSRTESGSGLGLAIARSIVELQGGSITVSSAGLGSGSLFTIRYPITPPA